MKKAKGVEKRPIITNLASKKPNWQPYCVCEGWAVLTRQRKNEKVQLLRNNSIVHAIR